MKSKKLLKAIKNPFYLMSGILHRYLSKYIKNDEFYIRMDYFFNTKKILNLKNPKTFNEKIQWLKLNNKNLGYSRLVDKYEVKKYIEETIGKEYVIPTLGIWNSFDEINFDSLPSQFVLKCTHDSGGLIICNDKNNFNKDEARKRINKSLNKNYYLEHREYPYKNVKPRIIAEKLMTDESGTELKDYKIFCFNGEPYFIEVDFNRFTNHQRNIYSIEWKLLNVEIEYHSNKQKDITKPVCLDEMLQIAKELSKKIPFVRVDLYVVKNQIYFGELTFFHGAGYEKFHPEKWNEKLGELINVYK